MDKALKVNAFGDGEIALSKSEIPTHYYNIVADLPEPMAPPEGNLDILPKIFPKSILEQEMSNERFVKIPDLVRKLYSKMGRPTPLHRAYNLEKYMGVKSKIFFKREDAMVTGSHKINTALPQAYYIKKDGYKHVTTETGAGQWGTALSVACNFLDLDCKVFMVCSSYDQKPGRKSIMKMYGADIISSPSELTATGRKILEETPETAGSLGIAISEAIEIAEKDADTVYSLGSVLNHVLMHQSVIGLELEKQLAKLGIEKPDVLIGCVGGGSNFGGIAYPFLRHVFSGKYDKGDIKFLAVEPSDVPSLTKGEYRYDYGDTMGLTPKFKMYTLGHENVPSPIHAGGLRYHGTAPSLAHLYNLGYLDAVAYGQDKVFEAAEIFAKTEGIIPAPESAHAIRAAMDEAYLAEKDGVEKNIVFNLSGHGLLDLDGYAKHFGF